VREKGSGSSDSWCNAAAAAAGLGGTAGAAIQDVGLVPCCCVGRWPGDLQVGCEVCYWKGGDIAASDTAAQHQKAGFQLRSCV
jgi:hypothetical protein